VEDSGE
jgi:hypothetical protein